ALFDARLFHQSVAGIGGILLMSLTKGQLNRIQVVAKRTADILVSISALILLSPILVTIGLVIKLTSRGPVLFRQVRLGVGGRPFSLYKFRTMVVDAEEILKRSPSLYKDYIANNFKLPSSSDPRVLRLGRFLRASSLDELPQFLNVLRGQMSLVG